MNLDLIIKIIAWVMSITPVVVFIIVSSYMIKGAAEDDETIMGLVMLAVTIFGIGVAILTLTYFTDLTVASLFG